MTEPSPYRVPLEDLVREVRVEPQALVESQRLPSAPQPDPRGESPDREWFHSGG